MSKPVRLPPCCTLCGTADRLHPAGFQQIYPQAESEAVRLDWWRCAACGAWFVWPPPSPEVITRHWSTVRYNSPEHEAEITHNKALMMANLLTSLAAQVKPGALLDMGSNFGSFLKLARQAGWEPIGFEPNPEAVAATQALGFEVHQGWQIDEAGFAPASFAAITAIDAFCYAWNPYTTLRTCCELLQPGGLLVMRLTNKRLVLGLVAALTPAGTQRDHRVSRLLQGQYHSVGLPALTRILRQIGFEPIRIEARATTAPWSELGRTTRIAYTAADGVYRLSFGRLNLHPGVLLFATKKG